MMRCRGCGGTSVQWQGSLGQMTHTRCADCGEIDCHERDLGMQEGEPCRRDYCEGVIEIKPTANCACHASPPCGGCVEAPWWCPVCHWESEE